MTIVKTMIASAKSLKMIRYYAISRLKSGRKKTSQGGVKCWIPRKPAPMMAVKV
jgi:hypothetical protein